ncbi:hypothetical protein C7H19_13635 [Aphanothece hegewaldii CCALA 016]|uniref:Uncharacterized protein n=1 Tax=Aphanothece hegewaldii CCALA 016 TaxID=2107694 RepID=A0A2T1LWH1_9CHRO|nr:hypothetical protein [Aphanothece hegewaldii]PSF36244.1 hypothetical protein C7H19_13635 [Aphanothece hegewaldii CCALA 016]
MQEPSNFSNQDSEERLSQSQIIEQLQKTITQLNSLVSKLNTESVEILPSKVAVDSWVVITERLIESLEPTPVISEEPIIIEPSFTEVSSEPTEPEIPVTVISEPEPPVIIVPPETPQREISKKPPLPKPPQRVIQKEPQEFNRSQTLWDGVLDTIRAFLPTSVSNKLSNWVLTGIVTGSLVIILLTSVSLLNPSPKQEISELPKIIIEDLPVEAPVEVTTEEPILEPIEETPKIEPEIIATPSEITAPEPPKPIIIEPPAPVVLTPEQNLIASIQAEIDSLTKQFPEGLVSSLQANFVDSLLTIFVNDDWYQLSESKQEELADSVWKRSQQLDFKKIEIKDAEKEIVARSPVVGDNVIIVKK